MAIKFIRKRSIIFWTGLLLGIVIVLSGSVAVKKTSTNEFCAACHIHPHSTESWKRSTHVDNAHGVMVNCVDCHLPPQGEGYLVEKVKTGARDVYGKLFKDPESLNWEEKSQPAFAARHVFKSSCINCHQNLFPMGMSEEGKEAHLYYYQRAEELHCINCHISVGHYDPNRLHAKNIDFAGSAYEDMELYSAPGTYTGLNDFTEYIPDSKVSFEMVALPGGTFTMGSPEDEPFRRPDEGPQREVSVDPFFMGRLEVTWDEYLAFFKQTGSEGKTADAYLNVAQNPDAISGPTPPWGAPDQGWGKGDRPAMTMTYHAAEVYCQWLSKITGKTYRLPTEAEWEYAARGGTTGPYYFEGDPAKFIDRGIVRKIFGVDTALIASNSIYRLNSLGKTGEPVNLQSNPFGLLNILGNVAEFCSDWYAPDAYATYPESGVSNPTGPATGEEHVVRGGSFMDEADRLRCAAREQTRTKLWLQTDPQIPKSIWWYSDCLHVGFRVVCEYEN